MIDFHEYTSPGGIKYRLEIMPSDSVGRTHFRIIEGQTTLDGETQYVDSLKLGGIRRLYGSKLNTVVYMMLRCGWKSEHFIFQQGCVLYRRPDGNFDMNRDNIPAWLLIWDIQKL